MVVSGLQPIGHCPRHYVNRGLCGLTAFKVRIRIVYSTRLGSTWQQSAVLDEDLSQLDSSVNSLKVQAFRYAFDLCSGMPRLGRHLSLDLR